VGGRGGKRGMRGRRKEGGEEGEGRGRGRGKVRGEGGEGESGWGGRGEGGGPFLTICDMERNKMPGVKERPLLNSLRVSRTPVYELDFDERGRSTQHCIS